MPFASDFIEQILGQLSEAILLAVKGNVTQRRSIPRVLRDLAKLEIRSVCLTEFAYGWCSAIYENREDLEGWESLLLACLELGFRHLDPRRRPTDITLTHTEHHRGLVDVVFRSQKREAIADFLHAWTTDGYLPSLAGEMVGVCIGQLVGLHNLAPFSPRLQQLVIRFVEGACYTGFEDAGGEKLIELLDHLHITIEETDNKCCWMLLLMDVIRSSEENQCLSHWYWELLVELMVLAYGRISFGNTDALKIAKSLVDAQEWGKLECWIGIVWMYSGFGVIPEEGLEPPTLLLFRHRPGAAQRLEQWIGRWSKRDSRRRVPESFQQILTQAHEGVQQQDAL